MNPSIATLVYACGIAGLFYLDRDKSVRTSKALWLPVVYLWVVGSRPVSSWLGIAPAYGTDVQLDGSPVDRVFFAALLIAAICVLVHRGRRIFAYLNANAPILVYFLFCLVSISWSDFPGVAFKRWTKAIGDLLMILIIVTDEQPVSALRRLFSRTGFILIPACLLFIKFYPSLGRGYDAWSGTPSNLGVTLNKNMLGVITLVLLLGAVWRVLALLRSDQVSSHRGRHLLAQGALLVLGVYLLVLTNSETSSVCFALGAVLLFATSLRFMRRHAAAVHALVLALVVIVGSVMLLGGAASVTRALGRNSTLTGRTDIWAAIIPMAPNPVIGAGFESFWLSPLVSARLWELFPGLPINEAHDGYIEVYLELGWVGVGLIGLILLDGYRRSVKAFRREPALGGLLIAYILCATIYSITEAGFRSLDPIWIFFLLAVIEASNIAAGVEKSQSLDASTKRVRELPAQNTLAVGPTRRTTVGKSGNDNAWGSLDRTGVGIQPFKTRINRTGH
jgi:exopolysaccharide production protein ExoQ